MHGRGRGPWLRPLQRGICTAGPSKNIFYSTGPLGEGAGERVLALLTQGGGRGQVLVRVMKSSVPQRLTGQVLLRQLLSVQRQYSVT